MEGEKGSDNHSGNSKSSGDSADSGKKVKKEHQTDSSNSSNPSSKNKSTDKAKSKDKDSSAKTEKHNSSSSSNHKSSASGKEKSKIKDDDNQVFLTGKNDAKFPLDNDLIEYAAGVLLEHSSHLTTLKEESKKNGGDLKQNIKFIAKSLFKIGEKLSEILDAYQDKDPAKQDENRECIGVHMWHYVASHTPSSSGKHLRKIYEQLKEKKSRKDQE
jgi:hypothetical protein